MLPAAEVAVVHHESSRRLEEIERENSTLKQLLADTELEKAALKNIARRWTPRR
jgi:hypothetical protein